MDFEGDAMNFLLDPNLAYLLLLAGTLLGLLALVTPGTGALEAGALFCLVLAGYAVTQLDFNLWALLLLILSIVPFVVAIRKPKRELYLALSILGLVVGSAYLFPGDGWIPAVNPILAVIASILYAGFLWLVIRKSMQVFLTPPTHDLGLLIGQMGEAKTRIHTEGSVQVGGELWSALSDNPIPAGTLVRVVRRDGFSLIVERQSSIKSN
jgi:membrane-bound serine protease (ClpP class)